MTPPLNSSPALRQARQTAYGQTSQSYDFGAMARSAKPTAATTRLTRPTTAPADRISFPIPSLLSKSPSSHGSSQPPSTVRPATVAGHGMMPFSADYNPWGTTYRPMEAFVSQIPISPAQPARPRPYARQSIDKRASQTDASLYKHSILRSSLSTDQARTRPASSPIVPSHHAFQHARTDSNLSSVTGRSASGIDTTNHQQVGIDLDDLYRRSMVSVSDEEAGTSWSPAALSPSQPAPASPAQFAPRDRRPSHHDSTIDRDLERAQAPHLYFETLGATSMRNPFAPLQSVAQIPAVSSVPSSAKVEDISPALRSPAPATLPAGQPDKKAHKRRSKKANSEPSIEFAFVRRRSEATADLPNEVPVSDNLPMLSPTGHTVRIFVPLDSYAAIGPRDVPREGIKAMHATEQSKATTDKQQADTAGSALPPHLAPLSPVGDNKAKQASPASFSDFKSPKLLQETLDQLVASPITGFRNPFLPGFAFPQQEAQSTAAPAAPSSFEGRNSLPTLHIAGDRPTQPQTASFQHSFLEAEYTAPETGIINDTHGLAAGHPKSKPALYRNPSSGNVSFRRPSAASGFSVSSYPTKPTNLEARRMTYSHGDESCRGIRVSLDGDCQ